MRDVIEGASSVSFFVPETAFVEAEEHVTELAIKRGGDPEIALSFLHSMSHVVELIGCEVYGQFEVGARERLDKRDPEDWPTWSDTGPEWGIGAFTWRSSSGGTVILPGDLFHEAPRRELVWPRAVKVHLGHGDS